MDFSFPQAQIKYSTIDNHFQVEFENFSHFFVTAKKNPIYSLEAVFQNSSSLGLPLAIR